MKVQEHIISSEISTHQNSDDHAEPAQAGKAHNQPERRGAHQNHQQQLRGQADPGKRSACQEHVQNVGIDFDSGHGNLIADGGKQSVDDLAATKTDKDSFTSELRIALAGEKISCGNGNKWRILLTGFELPMKIDKKRTSDNALDSRSAAIGVLFETCSLRSQEFSNLHYKRRPGAIERRLLNGNATAQTIRVRDCLHMTSALRCVEKNRQRINP